MFRNSSTYLYLAIALGLVCFLFIDKKIPGTKELEESQTVLFKLNADDVTGLEINNVHGVFIFQKNNNHWEIKKPITALADGGAVDEVINQIVYAQPQRVIKIDGSDKDQANLKEWGLSPAAERVVLHTKDKMYELLVGRKTAISDSVYARTSGRRTESVRIIANSVKTVLQKDISDFRSRNVFDFEIGKVNKITSRIANMGTTPAQEGEVELQNHKWVLEKPLVARASETEVQGLLNKILALRVTDFVNDDAGNLSPYGLTSPSALISITAEPNEEMVLEIGGPVPDKPEQVYAQRLKSNSVFTLPKSGVDDLFKGMLNLRDRHILPFEPGTATGLTFSFGNKKGQVRKESGLWNTVGDAEGRADVGKVTDLFSRLSQLETTPVLKDSATDLKPFGLDKPQDKITISAASLPLDQTLTLLIGKAENKLLYVRNSMEPFIYTVPDNAFDFLPDNNLALRNARVITLELNQVKSMTVVAGSEPAVTLTRSPGGTWTANVKNHMVDSVKADTQASLFAQLQAKAWLGPVQPSYGLGKPILTISAQTDKPAPTILHIGAPLPDGNHAAQVEGNPTVFEITDGDYGLLNTSSLQALPKILSPPDTAPTGNTPPATNAAAAQK
jgi:hypothetical protein